MKNKNLFLIASGRKRVEYRAQTRYWVKRLFLTWVKFAGGDIFSVGRGFKTIEFQCGYSRKYPRLKFNIAKIEFVKTPPEVKNTIKTKSCFAVWFE